MRLFWLIIFLALAGCTAICLSQEANKNASGSDKLSATDETEHWQYPYQATEEKRQNLLDTLDAFRDPEAIGDLIRKLGTPDRVDDLRKNHKPLSPSEEGFLAGSNYVFSYRCIWFARKASKSPGLSHSWLAAYVDKDEKTVSVIHNNWLKR